MGYASSFFDTSRETSSRRFSSAPERIATRRASVAAYPRDARPRPPAKRGLEKRVSRGRKEEEDAAAAAVLVPAPGGIGGVVVVILLS